MTHWLRTSALKDTHSLVKQERSAYHALITTAPYSVKLLLNYVCHQNRNTDRYESTTTWTNGKASCVGFFKSHKRIQKKNIPFTLLLQIYGAAVISPALTCVPKAHVCGFDSEIPVLEFCPKEVIPIQKMFSMPRCSSWCYL